MKNWKTTALGFLSIIAGALAIYLVIIERATLTEAGAYLALVLAFVEGVKSFFTKDHDKDNNSDIMAEDSIPGGGTKRPKDD